MIKWSRNFIGALALALTSIANADVVKLVVPFPPGGSTDLAVRYASRALNEAGINTVVHNRPGAQGSVGIRSVIDQGDNLTLVAVAPGSGIISPIMQGLSFDIQHDLEPVTGLVIIYPVVIVPAQSFIVDVRSLVSALKTSEKPLTFGFGASSHALEGLRMLDWIGAKAVEVSYNGTAPLAVAVAAGQIDFAVMDYNPTLKELVDAGKIRLIAATTKRRIQTLPNLPTLIESGINVEAQAWLVLLGKKGIDPKLISAINQILNNALKRDRAHLLFDYVDPLMATPDQVREMIQTSKSIVQKNINRLKK